MPTWTALPIPRSARGIATACASASGLIAAGVFPLMAALYGYDVPNKTLLLSPLALTAGGALHYLAACGATRRTHKKK